MVDPKEKLPGSTSVACWLVLLVKVSVLSFTSGVVAGGGLELFKVELEDSLLPQLRLVRTARAQQQKQPTDLKLKRGSPLRFFSQRFHKSSGSPNPRQCPL
jgi:hypothetical protein